MIEQRHRASIFLCHDSPITRPTNIRATVPDTRLVGGSVSVLAFLLFFVQFFHFALEDTKRATERTSRVRKALRSKEDDDDKNQKQPVRWFTKTKHIPYLSTVPTPCGSFESTHVSAVGRLTYHGVLLDSSGTALNYRVTKGVRLQQNQRIGLGNC